MTKLSQICQSLDVTITQDFEVNGLNTLQDATNNELSFIENRSYLKYLSDTKAGAVFVKDEFAENLPSGCQALICEEPYVAIARASQYFAPKKFETKGTEAVLGDGTVVQEGVYLGKNVKIGDNGIIMAGCVIGDNVTIGDDVVLYPNVTIYRDCHLGNQVMIHAGTVIGADGFGFAITKTGEYVKIYQNGNVVIGDDVEIGANTAIDRAAFATTRIGNHVRIDNLVQIGHNCELDDYVILSGQVGLAGSTQLGERVIMGGQAGAAGHLSIAPFTTIGGKGGVTKTLREGGHYAGFPLLPYKTWLKLQGKIQQLLKK